MKWNRREDKCVLSSGPVVLGVGVCGLTAGQDGRRRVEVGRGQLVFEAPCHPHTCPAPLARGRNSAPGRDEGRRPPREGGSGKQSVH